MVSKMLSTVRSSGLNTGDVLNVIGGVSDFSNAREQGDGIVKSGVKAAATFAWGEFYYGGLHSAITGALGKTIFKPVAGPIAMVAAFAPAVVQVAGASMEHATKVRSQTLSQRGRLGSGYFNMSESGYTMRQRSLNAIRSNGLNTQSILGNEARTYYRG